MFTNLRVFTLLVLLSGIHWVNARAATAWISLLAKVTNDNTVSGIVLAGNKVADQGIVWLVSPDNNYNAELIIDSTGIFHFTGVPYGNYYIYAMLTPGSDRFLCLYAHILCKFTFVAGSNSYSHRRTQCMVCCKSCSVNVPEPG